MTATRRRPKRLNQSPAAVTYAREKAGLSKRDLAARLDISEQLMGEIESGWRNATPARLQDMAEALNCPVVVLEAKRNPETVEAQADAEPEASPS